MKREERKVKNERWQRTEQREGAGRYVWKRSGLLIHRQQTAILLFSFFFLLFSLFSLSAQSTADEIEMLLGANAVTYAQAARLVLEASDAMITPNQEEAFTFALERKWLPKKALAGDTARLDGISLLLMRSFNANGGIFYSLAKSSHYAYRELVYKDVIQGRTDPAMAVSGEELLFLVGKMLSEQEDGRAARQRKGKADAEQMRLLQEINAQLAASGSEDISARITEQGVTINIPNIQFITNSAQLTQEGRDKLEEAARILKGVTERNILVGGHTALAGTPAEQQTTSLARAQAAADYLVSQGVRTREEITVRGYGAGRPLGNNTTEEGMAQNRRVEIIILTAEAMENLQ